ncbi:hypothetical protein ASD97_25980 [Streptomyces sp. Root63]|uniref:hypothetical protein n=1 Tax=unclassified Streptomyces TaxID=2593676 RepID=UPI0006F7C904|nr:MULTISPECIES: hypothetical protein [unclassified Streptomyces]KQX43525.1 hypothetical protein ASD29_32285 [Streptomyces sp. Root1295]KRA34088.1 hypothetical protein ASD97_25980 [Streptomyces sp. Root63]
MIQENVHTVEKVYVAGTSLENARTRRAEPSYYGDVERDTPQEAYSALGYWEEQEEPFGVYEFVVETRITKVEPPYSKVDLT